MTNHPVHLWGPIKDLGKIRMDETLGRAHPKSQALTTTRLTQTDFAKLAIKILKTWPLYPTVSLDFSISSAIQSSIVLRVVDINWGLIMAWVLIWGAMGILITLGFEF